MKQIGFDAKTDPRDVDVRVKLTILETTAKFIVKEARAGMQSDAVVIEDAQIPWQGNSVAVLQGDQEIFPAVELYSTKFALKIERNKVELQVTLTCEINFAEVDPNWHNTEADPQVEDDWDVVTITGNVTI